MEKANVVKTVGDAVWHRKLLIVAIFAVVLSAGVALYSVTPPSYEAQAQVYVDPAADQALQQGDGLLIRDIAQQATSRRVLTRAGQQLAGSPSPEQLAPRITAAVVQATNLVAINATAGSPQGAAELANAVATAVVAQHHASSAQRGVQSQTYLTGELVRLAAVIKADQAAGASIEQQNLDRQEYANTYTRLQDLQLRQTRAAESVSVTQQALAPDRPANPDLVRYLGVAAAAGVFIALLVALLVERFDDRVFDSETVASASGASLVVVPRSRRAYPDELPTQYTLAYAHIAARYPSARTIMVAAASHRESTDSVAAAFGSAAELVGDRAIVLQREPSAKSAPGNGSKPARRWPLVSRPGTELGMMTELAAGPNSLTLPALAIAAAPEHAASALDEPSVPRTFVAVPAPFLSPKAASLSHVVDVAIVVAVARATRIAEVVRTAECLRHVGVEPVAVILVRKGSPGHTTVEQDAGNSPGIADSITVWPRDLTDSPEDRQPHSVTPTTDTTETTETEATPIEAMPTRPMRTHAIPTDATPEEVILGDDNSIEDTATEDTATEAPTIDAMPIEISTTADDFTEVGDGGTPRRGDASSPARVDEILIATPNAVKAKADNLAGVGALTKGADQAPATSAIQAKTKAYRIKTSAGGSHHAGTRVESADVTNTVVVGPGAARQRGGHPHGHGTPAGGDPRPVVRPPSRPGWEGKPPASPPQL